MGGLINGEWFGNHRVQRVPTAIPLHLVQTYRITAPSATHRRPATCAEVECGTYVQGWRTTIDESTDLGKEQAGYIRHWSGRSFAEHRTEAGLTVFDFEPGQKDFAGDHHHTISLEREPLYIVRDGDWRGNPTGNVRRHADAVDFVDDFGEHQENIAASKEQG